jgi:hypothetical protein
MVAFENISGISNIVINAIFIRLGDRNKTRPAGVMRNIEITNMMLISFFEALLLMKRGPELPFFTIFLRP